MTLKSHTNHYNVKLLAIICIASLLVYSSEQAFASDTDNPQWHKYYQLGKFIYSKPPKPDQIFIYQYTVTNGTMIEFKGEVGAFTAQIQSNGNASFEIKIPRNFPYTDQLENGPRYGDTSPLFLMDVPPFGSPQKDFANTKTLKPANKTSDCFFTYSIPFSGNHKIQFAWTYMLSSSFPYHGDIIPQYCNDQTIAGYIPPLQQIKAGVDPKDVKCMQDLRLVVKSELGFPVCVKSDTAKKLIERGWALLPNSTTP